MTFRIDILIISVVLTIIFFYIFKREDLEYLYEHIRPIFSVKTLRVMRNAVVFMVTFFVLVVDTIMIASIVMIEAPYKWVKKALGR